MSIPNLAISYVSKPLYLSSSIVGVCYFVFAFVHLKLINNEYEERMNINVKKLSTKTALLAMREERLKKLTNELQKMNELAINKGNELEIVNQQLQDSIDVVLLNERKMNTQLNLIELKNKEILDSIEYANNIQHAILPRHGALKEVFLSSYLFYRSKDIVCGDFFYIYEEGSKVVLAAVDCTGHGVPGAMMTVIGYSQLSEIVQKMAVIDSMKILQELDQRIIEILQQGEENKVGDKSDANDGMDVSLVVYDRSTKLLQFSGANLPIYIVRENHLEKYSSSHIPVGGTQIEHKIFNKTEIQLMDGDQIYLFSDGYADQFGGELGKKYMTKKFAKFLLSINSLDMSEQKQRLIVEHDTWKGDEEQVDDILVMSFKI